MRLVLDTNVVVSALLWNGPPRHLLSIARGERVALFTSAPLIEELTDTLCRSKFDKKIAASAMSAEKLVDLYAELAAVVRPTLIQRLAPDPDDDVVIGTALAAKAGLLVTGDRSLLSVAGFEGGRIVSVTHALEMMRQP